MVQIAVVLLNRNDGGGFTTAVVTRQELGIPSDAHCRIRDLMHHEDIVTPDGSMRQTPQPVRADETVAGHGSVIVSAELAPHEAAALRVSCIATLHGKHQVSA